MTRPTGSVYGFIAGWRWETTRGIWKDCQISARVTEQIAAAPTESRKHKNSLTRRLMGSGLDRLSEVPGLHSGGGGRPQETGQTPRTKLKVISSEGQV